MHQINMAAKMSHQGWFPYDWVSVRAANLRSWVAFNSNCGCDSEKQSDQAVGLVWWYGLVIFHLFSARKAVSDVLVISGAFGLEKWLWTELGGW